VADKVIGFTLKVDGVDKTIKSIDDLDTSIAQLEDTLKSAEFGSRQFKEIEQDLVKARSAKEDLDKSLEGRGAEKRLQGLVGIAESLGGAFAIASQASALFGKENTAVAEAEAKAQQALAVVMGVRAIKEGLLNSALERKLILEKASTVGTIALNAVNKAFNLTLSMNPIGLVVTALGLLVVGVMAAIGPIKKLISSFDFLNDAAEATMDTLRNVASFLTGGLIDDAAASKTRSNAEKIIEAFDDVNSAGNQQIAGSKRRLALMEAQGASEAALLAQKKKINAEEVASRQAAIAQLLKLQAMDGELDDEKKKKLAELQTAIKDLNNQAQIDQAAYNKKVADDQKAANEKAAEKQKERKDKYNEHAKEMLDAAKEADKKTIELRQKAELDAIKDEEVKAQRTLQIQQENANKELQIQINKYASKKNLTKEEQKYLESLYAQQKQMQATQAGETQALLDDQAKVRKEKDAAFEKELKDIKDQAFLMSIEDQKVRAQTELQLQLDSQIAEINASELTETQKGEKIAAVREVNDAQKKEQDAAFKQKDMEDQLGYNQWLIGQEDTTYEEKIALNKANEDIISNMTFESENQRTAAIKENAKARADIDKAAADAKKANLEAISSMLGSASALLGQNTVAGKATAVAQTTIDTYLAAQKAYASLVGIPIVGPILAPINAGIAIAAGIKNIKAITSVKTPNGGGGGGNIPTAPSGGGGVTAPNFNIVGNSGINQLAELGGQPIQAYVVSGEVTSAQALDRNRIQNASF